VLSPFHLSSLPPPLQLNEGLIIYKRISAIDKITSDWLSLVKTPTKKAEENPNKNKKDDMFGNIDIKITVIHNYTKLFDDLCDLKNFELFAEVISYLPDDILITWYKKKLFNKDLFLKLIDNFDIPTKILKLYMKYDEVRFEIAKEISTQGYLHDIQECAKICAAHSDLKSFKEILPESLGEDCEDLFAYLAINNKYEYLDYIAEFYKKIDSTIYLACLFAKDEMIPIIKKVLKKVSTGEIQNIKTRLDYWEDKEQNKIQNLIYFYNYPDYDYLYNQMIVNYGFNFLDPQNLIVARSSLQ
jgi:hypothetical protein